MLKKEVNKHIKSSKSVKGNALNKHIKLNVFTLTLLVALMSAPFS